MEDVVVNQDLARIVLEGAGHRVDIASNGLEAIEAVQARAYDVVLMDVQMPVMDGIAATHAIRAADHSSRGVPIVAMTANVLPRQIADLKASGMDDHVGKPFKRLDLLAAIDRWNGRRPSQKLFSATDSKGRFDSEMFAALEDMLGEPSFRTVVEKFASELNSRFQDLLTCDIQLLSRDAHDMLPTAGSFGFSRLVSILRAYDGARPGIDEQLPSLLDLQDELNFVGAELDRYLVTVEKRSDCSNERTSFREHLSDRSGLTHSAG